MRTRPLASCRWAPPRAKKPGPAEPVPNAQVPGHLSVARLFYNGRPRGGIYLYFFAVPFFPLCPDRCRLCLSAPCDKKACSLLTKGSLRINTVSRYSCFFFSGCDTAPQVYVGSFVKRRSYLLDPWYRQFPFKGSAARRTASPHSSARSQRGPLL